MREVEGMAGSLSGYAGRNSLGLQAEFLVPPPASAGLELVADCLLNATFPETEIEHERRIVLDDIRAQEDNLTHVAFRAFHGTLWTRHPYRLDPLGTPALARGARRAGGCWRFYRQHYGPGGLTLAIVGDVDPDAVIAPAVGALSTRRRRRPAQAARAARRAAPRAPRASWSASWPREQAHLVLGFPGRHRLDSPDRFALELLAQVLSGQGGRLFVEIREKRALAYRVSAFSLEGLDPGYFAVYVGTSPEKVEEVLDAASALELRKLAERGGRRRTSWRVRSAT